MKTEAGPAEGPTDPTPPLFLINTGTDMDYPVTGLTIRITDAKTGTEIDVIEVHADGTWSQDRPKAAPGATAKAALRKKAITIREKTHFDFEFLIPPQEDDGPCIRTPQGCVPPGTLTASLKGSLTLDAKFKLVY